MRLNALLVAVAFLAISFAGCLDGPEVQPIDFPSNADPKDPVDEEPVDEEPADEEPADDEPADEEPADEEPADEENLAPIITLSFVASEANPLEVTFSMDGEDPEGQPITWTLDANGDGTFDAEGEALPAELIYEYPEDGGYNAIFTVSDGVHETVADAMVEVAAAVAAPPAQVVYSGETLSGSSPTARDTGAAGCVGFLLLENGLDCLWFVFTESHDSLPYVLVSDTLDIEFWADDCDPIFGTALAFESSGSGTVPAGAVCAVVWYFGPGTGLTYELTVG